MSLIFCSTAPLLGELIVLTSLLVTPVLAPLPAPSAWCPALSPPSALWSLSRKTRNRRIHALNGNRPPRHGAAPAAAGEAAARLHRLEPRQLQDLQLARTLRAAGWALPNDIHPDAAIRVYDTRLAPSWLTELAADLRHHGDPQRLCVVGGDFVSAADVTDADALQCERPRPWGADGATHIFIPPRPHLEKWVARVLLQLDLEHVQSIFSMCCVVDRDRCPAQLDEASIRRLIPQAAALLDDKRLSVRAVAVGERARLVRVPATVMQLPPPMFEDAFLPRSKVLLVLHFRRAIDGQRGVSGRWIRGHLPDPEPSDLELLRLEYELPPATRERHAEKETRRALQRAATAVGVAFTAAHRLRQVQAAHGGNFALLAVPRVEARQWLRASGCAGLFLRPFWTPTTAPELGRNQFELLWLRGRRKDAARVWEAVHDLPGVFGLLPGEKDIAIRLSVGADRQQLEAKVRLILGDHRIALHQATAGTSWWRFGPLEDSDVFRLRELIAQTGLTPLRDDVRLGSAGPFRRVAFFAAVGQPTRTSLDDGSWGRSCAARLTPAPPPPRPLPPTATWGGPRQSPSPALSAVGVRPPSAAPLATVAPARPAMSPPGGPRSAPPSSQPSATPTSAVPSRRKERRPPPSTQSAPSAAPASVMEELQQLRHQLSIVMQQLTQVLEENAQLRRELQAARTCSSPPGMTASSSTTMPPRPSSPLPPSRDLMEDDDDDAPRRRPRDSNPATPEKPSKEPRRSVSEGAHRDGH